MLFYSQKKRTIQTRFGKSFDRIKHTLKVRDKTFDQNVWFTVLQEFYSVGKMLSSTIRNIVTVDWCQDNVIYAPLSNSIGSLSRKKGCYKWLVRWDVYSTLLHSTWITAFSVPWMVRKDQEEEAWNWCWPHRTCIHAYWSLGKVEVVITGASEEYHLSMQSSAGDQDTKRTMYLLTTWWCQSLRSNTLRYLGTVLPHKQCVSQVFPKNPSPPSIASRKLEEITK